MGRRGPAKLPSNVVRLRNNPGKRPINEDEPRFAGDAKPTAQVLKDEGALALWNEKAPELIEMGLLTFQGSTAFSQYCLLCAMRDRLWSQIDELGEELAIAKGLMKNYLAVDTRCDRWGAQFGLTPSNSTSIKAKPKDKPAGAKRFLA